MSHHVLVMLLVATVSVAATFVLVGRYGFQLSDEGFLWYGSQRVMLGEVPLRDFMSYAPGRYYWSAGIMRLWGDNGIMALRASVAIFQALGLFVALLLVAPSSRRPGPLFWIPATVILMVWMYPRHKLFDIALSITMVGVFAFLVQRPSMLRYFLSGLAVGAIALFGENHGAYGVFASLTMVAYLVIGRRDDPAPLRAVALWAAGVVVGYLPILAMLGFVPGFGTAFWDGLREIVGGESTNLPRPVPWPWRAQFAGSSTIDALRGFLIGTFFVGVVAFPILGVAWSIRQRLKNRPVPPAFVASAFVALPYAHHALSRADLSHLAQAIFPLLIGSLAVAAGGSRGRAGLFASMLCGASLIVMLPAHPAWRCLVSQKCMELEVGGSRLEVDTSVAASVTLLNDLARKFAPEGRSFLAVPHWPGAYAVLERKSPIWEIYALFPRDEAFERKEIERIRAANPTFVVILDIPVDGRDDLRFSNTHPMIDRYLHECYQSVDNGELRPIHKVYILKNEDNIDCAI